MYRLCCIPAEGKLTFSLITDVKNETVGEMGVSEKNSHINVVSREKHFYFNFFILRKKIFLLFVSYSSFSIFF